MFKFIHNMLDKLPYGLLQSPLNEQVTIIKYPVTIEGYSGHGESIDTIQTFGVMSTSSVNSKEEPNFASFPCYFGNLDFNLEKIDEWILFFKILLKHEKLLIKKTPTIDVFGDWSLGHWG